MCHRLGIVVVLLLCAASVSAQSLPAEAGSYGAAPGGSAQAGSYGAAPGGSAQAGSYGAAAGGSAQAGSYGAAAGGSAQAGSYGAAAGGPAQAGSYQVKKARRQFITISYDWLYTQPLHFAEHPLADLVGKPVSPTQFEAYDYRTSDGEILIDVVEFKRRTQGAGVTVYPFGASAGPTLALRASFEDLPDIRIAFAGAGAPADYALIGARAYDIAAYVHVADHAPGWGLGSHAFVGGGIGRIRSDLSDGDRYFAEGGGGLSSGPLGIELAVKVAWNHLDNPVEHRFLTIPVTLRGTVSF